MLDTNLTEIINSNASPLIYISKEFRERKLPKTDEIIQKLASNGQYLCFFGADLNAFVIRAAKQIPKFKLGDDFLDAMYELFAVIENPLFFDEQGRVPSECIWLI